MSEPQAVRFRYKAQKAGDGDAACYEVPLKEVA